jgi:colanic acid/amylovoran biosynthesis glycosyltransferase
MKVLFISGTFPQLTFIFRTVCAIAEQGHEVTVMARDPGNWKQFVADFPLPSTLTVKYLIPDTRLFTPKRFSRLVVGLITSIAHAPIASWQLLKLCRQQSSTFKETLKLFFAHIPFLRVDTDIIQFEFYLTKSQYTLLDKIVNAPIIVSCRGADVHFLALRNRYTQEIRLKNLLSASLIHCVSKEMAETVTQITGRSEGLWINRPAVPFNKISPKSQYNIDTVPTIITVGRLFWKKGFDYLLAALQRLKVAGIPFKAQIIGTGDLQAQMRFSVDDLDLSPEIDLVGQLKPDEVLNHLREADIYVLSSHEEGISNAVLEAMGVGLPIITTAAGGMEEAVRDGLDGYVIPVRDIPAMVEKLTALLGDAQLRERMGRSARERIKAEFTLERQAKVFGQMYEAARSQRLPDTTPIT